MATQSKSELILPGPGRSPNTATTCDSVDDSRWLEKRAERRYAVIAVVDLIPLDDESDRCIGEPFVVECRDVSRGGIRVRARQLFTYSTVGLALPLGDDPDAVWVTRLRWCRRTSDGFYESGGAFLRVINRLGIENLPERQRSGIATTTASDPF